MHTLKFYAIAIIGLLIGIPMISADTAPATELAKIFDGKIGQYPVVVMLRQTGGAVSGSYAYEGDTPKLMCEYLFLKGSITERDDFLVSEMTNNKETGSFYGKVSAVSKDALHPMRIRGVWKGLDIKKELPFEFVQRSSSTSSGFILADKRFEPNKASVGMRISVYPQLLGPSQETSDAFNHAINEFIKTHIQDISNDISYEVRLMSPDIISIQFTEEFLGGAHPAHAVAGFNFDLRLRRTLDISDLFMTGVDYLNVLSKIMKQSLKSNRCQFAEDLFLGASVNNWTLDRNGVLFSIEVPHVVGDVMEVYVPYRRLIKFIHPMGPLQSVSN